LFRQVGYLQQAIAQLLPHPASEEQQQSADEAQLDDGVAWVRLAVATVAIAAIANPNMISVRIVLSSNV
jgi:hypothetical protein